MSGAGAAEQLELRPYMDDDDVAAAILADLRERVRVQRGAGFTAPGFIARRLESSTHRVRRILRRLEADGMVERAPPPHGSRWRIRPERA